MREGSGGGGETQALIQGLSFQEVGAVKVLSSGLEVMNSLGAPGSRPDRTVVSKAPDGGWTVRGVGGFWKGHRTRGEGEKGGYGGGMSCF